MASAREVLVKFLGDTKGLKDAAGEAEGAVSKFGGALDSVAKVGTAALAGVGVAAVGAGAVGLKAFSEFQSGMNEVMTLLPGAGQETFDSLANQVKGFSTEFGVLPNDVIPALYQSLSAGVPQDNVFAFLETAQKAAKGGVTDLETAVDGISSVVNAYGPSVLSATQASDLMFTAVRLGKTDFDQLSKSLFNVVPTAASMGVGLEDVTAALARLTAQGTPTSVATTQLRQLFVEAAKDGSNLDKAIREISGQGFTELVAGGKDVGSILQMVRQTMPDDEFRNLFGSVEAAAAALGITGPQFEQFQAALADMGDSAGATDAAFQTMDRGLGPAMARIKAQLAVAAIELGERLAPAAEKVARFIAQNLPRAFDALGTAAEKVGRIVGPYITTAFELAGEAVEKLRGPVERVVEYFRTNETAMRALGVGIAAVFGLWAVAAGAAAVATLAAAAPVIALVAVVGALAAGIYLLVTHWDQVVEKFPQLGTIVEGVVAGFRALVDGVRSNMDTILAIVKPILDQLALYVRTAFAIITNVIALFVAVLTGDWQGAWDAILGITSAVWELITGTIDNAIALITAILGVAWDVIKAAAGAAWEAVQGLISGAWEGITGAVTSAKDGLIGLLQTAWDTIKGAAQTGWDTIKGVITGAVDGMKGAVSTSIDTVVGFFRELPGRILGAIGNLGSLLLDAGKQVIQGLIDGMKSIPIPNPVDMIPGAGAVGGFFKSVNPFSTGTWDVPGPRGAGDVVPALLSPGEMVLPVGIANQIRGLPGGPGTPSRAAAAGAGGTGVVIHVHGDIVADNAQSARRGAERLGYGVMATLRARGVR